MALLLGLPAQGAKVEPMSKLEKLPEKEDEAALWATASGHENRLRNNGTVFHDRHIEAYLESLSGRMLGPYLDHLGIKLDFVLVAKPTLSGWCYPYGTIGLNTGLLVRMDNEAQLGAILAHEISHFLQRHTYRELIVDNQQSILGKGLGILAAAAAAKQTGVIDTSIMDFTRDLWTNFATSGYSKKNEYVADEEGLMLMARAGLARDEAIPAFTALGENRFYGAADPRNFWSSHPKLEDRIRNLQKEIKSEKRNKNYEAGIVPDPEAYYRGIAPALLINARLDINEQQYQRARDSLNKYVMVRPDDPAAYFLLGETYRREAPFGPDFSDTVAAYGQALEEDSGYALAHKELGMTYRVQQQNDAALEAFEKYLALAEDAPDAGIIRAYMEALQ